MTNFKSVEYLTKELDALKKEFFCLKKDFNETSGYTFNYTWFF